MQRMRVLKVTLLALGVCLCTAWFGASNAAAQQPAATGRTSAAADEGLVLLKSDTESIILELRTPSYQMEEIGVDGVAYHLLTVAGYGQTGDVGHPQLPLKGTLLGIPPTAEFSLNVLEVEEEIVSERYNIYPVPQPVFERDLEGDLGYMRLEFAKDESVYSSDRFYPASIAEVGSSGFIRDQRVVELRFFPFQYNPVSGELRQCQRIRVELSFSYPRGHPLLAETWEEDDTFSQVLENSLLNYDSASNWRARASITSLEAMAGEQPQPSYKVLLDQDGIYQLSGADLQAEGIDIGTVVSDTFKLHNQGNEVAIYVADDDGAGDFDPEDYILFYGQQMTTVYTNTNVYWLTMDGSSGLRMAERGGTLGAGTVLTSFHTTNHWEQDLYHQSIIAKPDTIPSEEEKDHWFGGFIAAFGGPASESYTIMLHNLAISPPPYSSTVRGSLHGFTDFPVVPDHRTRIYLNGHLLDDAYWDGQVEYQFETDVPESYLIQGSNTISVECPLENLPLVEYDIVFANWFEIDYHRTYTVENDSLFFDGDEAGTWQYEVGDFLTDTIDVFDVTDPLSVTRMVSTTVVASDSYSLRFEDTINGEHHYLALTPAQYHSPLDIVKDTPSSLKDTSNRADYLIITHPDFYDAVLPLRDHREAQGLDTKVVDVGDVYDEFSYGIFDPHAIRDFLTYAYGNWVQPAPSYVLLVGDGNYDFKDNFGFGEPNYIPPYLVYTDEWVGEAAADNRYVCVSGDDILPDMHIGRLPAHTAAQASAMVSKIINYEQNPPEGDWKRQVLFVADNPDDAGDFRALSDDIADNHLPSSYSLEKAYYGVPPTYTSPIAVKNAITTAFGTGRLFINYVGHGSYNRWGTEQFLTVGDVDSLPESQKMPMMVAMTCLEGYFIHPSPPGGDLSCVGESLVRAEAKGAVASWSPTSAGVADGHHYLHQGFYDAVFVDGVHQIGPATLLGKLDLYYNAGGNHRELIDTYIVFGDPALHLPIERYVIFAPLILKEY